MAAAHPAYLELIEFIAGDTTPEQIIAFHPSAQAQERIEDLLVRERENQLSSDERAELDHFFQLEHILRVAKARAEQFLARAS